MTGPILEKNHMLAIMLVEKIPGENPLKGKALDFEMILQERIQTDHNDQNDLLEIKF